MLTETSVEFSVSGAAATVDPTLAVTGSSSGWYGMLGVVLLTVGVGLVRATRRRLPA